MRGMSNDELCKLFVSDEPRSGINHTGSMRIIEKCISFEDGFRPPRVRTPDYWELTTYGVVLAVRDHTIDEIPRIYINPAQYSITSSKQRSGLYAVLSWRANRRWEYSDRTRTKWCDSWSGKGGYDGEWQEYLPTNQRSVRYDEQRERAGTPLFDYIIGLTEEIEPLVIRDGVTA